MSLKQKLKVSCNQNLRRLIHRNPKNCKKKLSHAIEWNEEKLIKYEETTELYN